MEDEKSCIYINKGRAVSRRNGCRKAGGMGGKDDDNEERREKGINTLNAING